MLELCRCPKIYGPDCMCTVHADTQISLSILWVYVAAHFRLLKSDFYSRKYGTNSSCQSDARTSYDVTL